MLLKKKHLFKTNNGKEEVLNVGDIWWYDDSKTTMGTGKIRPCVIVEIIQNSQIFIFVRIAPLTEWVKHYHFNPKLVRVEPNSYNCLVKSSAIDVGQEQPIPLNVLTSRLGKLSSEVFRQMLEARVI